LKDFRRRRAVEPPALGKRGRAGEELSKEENTGSAIFQKKSCRGKNSATNMKLSD